MILPDLDDGQEYRQPLSRIDAFIEEFALYAINQL